MTSIPIIILVSSLLSMVTGTFVLLHAPRRIINHAFFAFALGVFLWIGAYGLIRTTQRDTFLPVLNFGGLVLVAGLTRFAQVFPTRKSLPVRPLLFWFPLIVGGLGMLLSNTIILHVVPLPSGELNVIHGPLINLWSLLLLTYILISLGFFIRSYIHAHRADRERLWFVYLGIAIFVLCSILFDAILPGFFGVVRLNYLGPLSSLLFLCCTAYGILKHEFMDIRIVIQRSFIYSVAFFLLAALYIALLLSLEHLSEGMVGVTAPVSAGITILIGMYTLPYMEAYFRRISDPIFFKDRYDYFAVLEELSTVLNTNLNLRPLVLRSLAVLDRTFKPRYSYFMHAGSMESFSHDNSEYMVSGAAHESRTFRIPIYSGIAMIGEYVIGPKRSGDHYTHEDRSLLRTFGTNATVAFEKAELYQRLREHTEQLEQKVEERTQHLQELQTQQREFFDDISHALQTPLTVLKSGVELLKRFAHDQNSKAYISMERSIDDLSRLTRSILELARIDTYARESDMARIDLSLMVANIAEYVAVVAETAGIILTTDIAPNILIRGDERQFEEALTNILSNAVKYTSGCSERRIHVSLTMNEKQALIGIRDSGIGMEPAQLANVFERFYRTESGIQHKEGFGLGLAITKRIIERHVGTITLESSAGIGTNVYITLPYIQQ